MHTDDGIDLVSNVTRDLYQSRDIFQYVYQNGNVAKTRAFKYRHRFGIAFDQRDYVSSNVISRGLNWISCEEISGNSIYTYNIKINLLQN